MPPAISSTMSELHRNIYTIRGENCIFQLSGSDWIMAQATDKRLILLITCMAVFITPFLGSSINIALPTVAAEFNADPIMLGWVAMGFLLSAAIFVVPFGRIADIYGRRIVFIAGLLIVIVSSFFCSISSSLLMLIVSRVIEGFGSAMLFGTSIAILTSVYPAKERGKVLGINVAIVYTGLSVGPFLGGIITQYAGWRSIYAFAMAYSLIIAVLALWKLKDEWRCAETERFDYPGCILYGFMLFALMYGLSLLPALEGSYWLIAGIIGLAAFIWWDMRHKNPVIKVRMFRNNITFTFSNMAALINYSATFAVSFLLSIYLQNVQGFNPQYAGLILISAPVVQAVFSPVTGRLSDKIEPRIVASAGMGMCVLGLSLFALLTAETSLIFIIAGLMLLGLGFALFSSPNTNAIMSSVDRCDYGVASGMVSTMRLIGQMMSLGIAMLTFSVFMGRVEISSIHSTALMSSIKAAFVIFAILCVFGLFASMMRGNLRADAPAGAQPQKQ
jgi:EmrB/QacA subfamily drug resistance transporter